MFAMLVFPLLFATALAAPATDVHLLYDAIVPLQNTVRGAAKTVDPVVITTQFHSQDQLGQYTYGYASSDGTAKVEIKDHTGVVAGKYAYIDPNGHHVEVYYIADKDGFHPQHNNLPQAPAVPEVPADLQKAYDEANARLAAAYESMKTSVVGSESGTSGSSEVSEEPHAAESIVVPVTYQHTYVSPRISSMKRAERGYNPMHI